ncbi:hypothetical protein [Shewanella xiamenensis]|uniref:hypothetical protein n=1 Tax=Shewanella xiamenensis TaxID=332186 RepID=UPI0035BB5B15
MLKRLAMVISETTVRPMDGAVEHPRTDLLRVVEQMPWLTYKQAQKELKNLINHSPLYLLY